MMPKILRSIIVAFLILGLFDVSLANNLSISNVRMGYRDQAAGTVDVLFDIRWDNSWRDSINHDAAWVFIKMFDPAAQSGKGQWLHGTLTTEGYNPPDTSIAEGDTEIIDGEYSMRIWVPTDKAGAMIMRAPGNTGQSGVSAKDVTLRVAIPPSITANTSTEARVFGTEMVYIPEGAFQIGDGNGSNESTYAFHQDATASAARIVATATNNIRIANTTYDDNTFKQGTTTYGLCIKGDGGLHVNESTCYYPTKPLFPTGYLPVYLMKYEISQGQFKNFLNMLTQTEQHNRTRDTSNRITAETAAGYYLMVSGAATAPAYRQSIKAGPNPADGYPYVFYCDLNDDDKYDGPADGETLAMNYLTFIDIAAYADWAGLRPYTELEFEKAARGPSAAVYKEYPWGTTDATLTAAQYALMAGSKNEVAANSSGMPLAGSPGLITAELGGLGLSEADNGPMRVGFAATSTTNRVQSGAGYFGNMDLGGNVWETIVTVGHSWGRQYLGTHGDGALNTTASYEGNATNSDWPGFDFANPTRGVTGATETGWGVKGSSFSADDDYVRVSDRTYASYAVNDNLQQRGGRLARTALNYQTKIAGTGYDGGGAGNAWTNASNITADDGSYATAAAGTTRSLSAIDFGFSIPTSAIIEGIVVTAEVYHASGAGLTGGGNLIVQAAPVTTGSANLWNNNALPTAAGYVIGSGGAREKWGRPDLTPDHINNSTFGASIKFQSGTSTSYYVDWVKITVFYSLATKEPGVGL